jgi:hypothetical protein
MHEQPCFSPGTQGQKGDLAEAADRESCPAKRPANRVADGSIFDRHLFADLKTRDFYNRYLSGEKMGASWVNPGDFEKDPLD